MYAAAPAMSRDEQLMESFRAVCQRYEISEFFARKLKQLEGWEIVLILDDSGSMNTPLQNQSGASAFAKSITRWDEVRATASEPENDGARAGAAHANGIPLSTQQDAV